MMKRIPILILAAVLAASLTACSGKESNSQTTSATSAQSQAAATADNASVQTTTFTERDLQQSADTSQAKTITLSDGKTETVTAAGVYVITGSAKDAGVIVDAGDNDKVQLVLSGADVTNSSTPAIYVKNADKVFVTTEKGTENTLSVTGTFSADGDTKTDAVIFSKDDLVLNGEGTLTVQSSNNGIAGKDDVKITGGAYQITSAADAIEAKDSLAIADGSFTIQSQKDGLHAENSDDQTKGSIDISGGNFTINAASDGIQGTTTVVIDGGTFDINAAEGIEATNVTINNGNVTIAASDDGINAAAKSTAQSVAVTINGGTVKITMGQGDTDGIDSNGDLYIHGGTVDITGQSACDYDGKAEKTGGTLIVNGTETDTIPNQFMGGMGGGMEPGGNMPGGQTPPGGQMPNGQMPGGQMQGGF